MNVSITAKSQSYRPLLDGRQTTSATKLVNESFPSILSTALNLTWVTAPQVVESGLGLNDDLNSVERPVAFEPGGLRGVKVEVVQSLAKWKRTALGRLNMMPGEGIYSDLNAIRPDEMCGPFHSLCVDQWEWERCVGAGDRNLVYLQRTVERIYQALRTTEERVARKYPVLGRLLPEDITFIHAEDLLQSYPTLTPQTREDRVTEEHKAVFVVGVGACLSDGQPHDGRAPDYDDWSTPNGHGLGLNGDLLVWHPVLERAMELSSMGIRVNQEALLRQLEIRGKSHWKHREFHRTLLEGNLPLSIGGGIGKSRVCMYLLRKAHIGEVQASVWPEAIQRECDATGIPLL